MAAIGTPPQHLRLKVEDTGMGNLFALVAAADRQREKTKQVFERTLPTEVVDLDPEDRDMDCSVYIDLGLPPSSTKRVGEISKENLPSAIKRRRSDRLAERSQSSKGSDSGLETPPPPSLDQSLLPLENPNSKLFEFNGANFVQHRNLQKLTPRQLEHVKEAVIEAASEYPFLKDIDAMAILSFGIRDNFGMKTKVNLGTVIKSWAQSVSREFAEEDFDQIHHTLLKIREEVFRKLVHGFKYSTHPEGPNQPGKFSLDDFQIDDTALATPERIANLSIVDTRKLRQLIQKVADSSFQLKKLPPALLWRMSIVSVRENFGTTVTLKEFIQACLKNIPEETAQTINIARLEVELADIRLTAKSFADPRRSR